MPQEYSLILGLIWQIIRPWWWVVLPFILAKPLKFLWHYWRAEEWIKRQKMILLEIKIPEEVLKPIRAMEIVFAGIWQAFYDPPNWWEEWVEGKFLLGFHLEVVSIGGEIHFLIRCPEYRRDIIESNVYSQYPKAEISLAEDYTKYVPQDIPNKDWDSWAADYSLLKPNPYPIKTYTEFEKETEKEEEKRVDPIATLLELMAKVKPGEQLWVQISASPIAEEFAEPFFKEGKRIRDKLAKRPEVPQPRPMIQEAAEILITGKRAGEEEKPPEVFPPEMKLTPGEREIVAALEKKISKPVFRTNIRFIYLGKRDVYFKPNLRLIFSFFASYFTENCNALVPWGQTITKIKQEWWNWFWFVDRRLYLRKRKLFRNYRERLDSFFPRSGKWPGVFILNTEELASLFHFPGRAVAPAPGVSRVEAKRGEAPPELPTE